MGEAVNPDTGLREPLRMAPVCGQACVHLHTRWLFGSDILNSLQNINFSEIANYRGWDDHPIGSYANSLAETPLVPANQRVRVAVTDPSRAQRATPHSILDGTTTTHGVREPNPALSPTNRAIWYDVDIVGHIEPGRCHVIFEYGWGYACDHSVNVSGEPAVVAWEPRSIRWLRMTAYYFGYNGNRGSQVHLTDPFEPVMMFVYNCWQFHLHGGEQIPEGDELAGNSVSLEDF